MTKEHLRQPFEGQLCKYTNVMKGWQYRWFVLLPETGVLEYFVTDSEKRQRPRGSVHLAGAVISPSDEDSNTFTVNSASGEVYKLRALDAKERQEWVKRLRAIAELHTQAIANSNPPLPPLEHHSGGHRGSPPSLMCPLSVLDAFSSVRQYLRKTELNQHSLAKAIEDVPSSSFVSCVDTELLVMKATSRSMVVCLEQALRILHEQQLFGRNAAAALAAPPVLPRVVTSASRSVSLTSVSTEHVVKPK